MNPNDVAGAINRRKALASAILLQQAKIDSRLDRIGLVSPDRRANVRAKGYRGPLTRHDLERMTQH